MLIRPSVARCTEAPYTSAGRASVGLTAWTIEDRSPWAHPQQTWHSNLTPEPTHKLNISKQALTYAFNRGMGNGKHASVTKSYWSPSCPKCDVEINHSAKLDRKKTSCAKSSKTATILMILKTETLIQIPLQRRVQSVKQSAAFYNMTFQEDNYKVQMTVMQ